MCLINHHGIKMYSGVEAWIIHTFSTETLGRGEWPTHIQAALPLGERTPVSSGKEIDCAPEAVYTLW
jgi:hypothetical protein